MQLYNSPHHYGLIAILLHWIVALMFFVMLALGLWMVDLSYYHTWYHQAPYLHKSLGIVTAILLLFRLFWRIYSPPPMPLTSYTPAVRFLSRLGHHILYLGLLAIVFSGYLIATAQDQSVAVFNWFSVPSIIHLSADQTDIIGRLHLYIAWIVCIMAILHALIALKHHVIDKDSTLIRMLGK